MLAAVELLKLNLLSDESPERRSRRVRWLKLSLSSGAMEALEVSLCDGRRDDIREIAAATSHLDERRDPSCETGALGASLHEVRRDAT